MSDREPLLVDRPKSAKGLALVVDRLTSIDASFLAQEREGSHMHIGGLLIFEGDPPSKDELAEHIHSRLHLVPRYRHKLSFPRFEMGRPLWVEDPSFNIGYHVRHTALPAPGSVEQLRLLVSRIFSQRLDRSKPLWELWLVEGYQGGFAIVSKVHHAVVDGVSGADLTTVLFDLSKDGTEVPPPESSVEPRARAQRRPGRGEGRRRPRRRPVGLAKRALGAVTDPGRTIDQAREVASGVGEIAWSTLNSAPETPLNGPIGPHRRVTWVRMPLADLKAIKNALGGTVNDVFLATVAGALHNWLRTRGMRTEGLEIRSAVPVSVRAEGAGSEMGNQITVMVGKLPTYAPDPVERLRVVSESMKGLKESKQAARRPGHRGGGGLRPADDLRPGLAPALLQPHVQPAHHQRARPAVPALPARARDEGDAAGRVPRPGPAPRDRVHELQRHRRAVDDRRLRRHARPRGALRTW